MKKYFLILLGFPLAILSACTGDHIRKNPDAPAVPELVQISPAEVTEGQPLACITREDCNDCTCVIKGLTSQQLGFEDLNQEPGTAMKHVVVVDHEDYAAQAGHGVSYRVPLVQAPSVVNCPPQNLRNEGRGCYVTLSVTDRDGNSSNPLFAVINKPKKAAPASGCQSDAECAAGEACAGGACVAGESTVVPTPSPDAPPGGDSDNDGVADPHDNCVATANPKQEDSNKNNVGDLCEQTETPQDSPPSTTTGTSANGIMGTASTAEFHYSPRVGVNGTGTEFTLNCQTPFPGQENLSKIPNAFYVYHEAAINNLGLVCPNGDPNAGGNPAAGFNQQGQLETASLFGSEDTFTGFQAKICGSGSQSYICQLIFHHSMSTSLGNTNPVFGKGTPSGIWYHSDCPAGEIIVGLKGNVANQINELEAICQKPQP